MISLLRLIMKQNQALQSRYITLTDLQGLLKRLFGHDWLIEVCLDNNLRALGFSAECKTGAYWELLLNDPSTAYRSEPVSLLRQRTYSF